MSQIYNTLEPVFDAYADAIKQNKEDITSLNGSLGTLGTLIDVILTDTASGDIASFNDGADDIPVKNLTVNIDAVQDLNGYDRPWIAGGGINIWDEEWEQGRIANGANSSSYAGFRSKNKIKINPNTTYYLHVGSTDYGNFWVSYYDENEVYIPTSNASGYATLVKNSEFTTPENAYYMRFFLSAYTVYKNDISINYPSTNTEYYPYSNICPISGWTGTILNCNIKTINIDWTNEAGTVYGGSLDVTTGLLTVTHAIKSFTRGINLHSQIHYRFYINSAFSDCGEGTPLCNMFSYTNKAFDKLSNGEFGIDTNYTRLYFGSSAFSDATEANAFFAENPLIVAYPLAIPVTHQLTPQEVKTILGENNIFADTGNVSVEYRADIKKYLDDVKVDLDNTIEVTESVNRFNGTWLYSYINTTGKNGDSEEYAHTEKIPVLGTSFVFTGSSIISGKRMNIPCRFITAYDDNDNVLTEYGQQNVGSGNSYIDTDGVNIITLDASVKSVVLSVYKPSDKYTDMCVSFDTSVIDYVPYGKTTKIKTSLLSDSKYATIYNYLHGKTIAVFGDSIMYGAGSDSKGAVDLLAEKYGMTVAKYCVSGATMGVRTDSPSYTVDEAHHIAKQVRNAIADNISPDIIVFNGGTNDIGGGITIGTISEVYTQPATENYFADGFEMVAYLLTNAFVGVPIIYMRAHNMSSRSYTGQVQYGELGNEISRKWGIATVDMYKKMNTQLAAYRTLYLADYTHPNANGYKKYYIPALEDYVMSALAEVN